MCFFLAVVSNSELCGRAGFWLSGTHIFYSSQPRTTVLITTLSHVSLLNRRCVVTTGIRNDAQEVSR